MERSQKYWLLYLTLSPTPPSAERRETMCCMMAAAAWLPAAWLAWLARHLSSSWEKLVLTSRAPLSTRKGLTYLSPSSELRKSVSHCEAAGLRVTMEWMVSTQSDMLALQDTVQHEMKWTHGPHCEQ